MERGEKVTSTINKKIKGKKILILMIQKYHLATQGSALRIKMTPSYRNIK